MSINCYLHCIICFISVAIVEYCRIYIFFFIYFFILLCEVVVVDMHMYKLELDWVLSIFSKCPYAKG